MKYVVFEWIMIGLIVIVPVAFILGWMVYSWITNPPTLENFIISCTKRCTDVKLDYYSSDFVKSECYCQHNGQIIKMS